MDVRTLLPEVEEGRELPALMVASKQKEAVGIVDLHAG